MNGVAGEAYDEVWSLSWDKERQRWGYAASLDGRYYVVVDGEAAEVPGRPGREFDPSLRGIPYLVSRDKKIQVIVDGVRSPEWDGVSSWISVSDDRRRHAYFARSGDQIVAVVDGLPSEPFDDLVDWPPYANASPLDGSPRLLDSPRFSRGGRHVAYAMISKGKRHMVVNGVKSPPYDYVSPPHFSEDGSRFGYFASHGRTGRLVLDGGIDHSLGATGLELVFSPDGRRVGVVVQEGNRQFPVVDGIKGRSHRAVDHLTFSPDGRRVAYLACDSEKRLAWKGGLLNGFVVLDGKQHDEYDAIDRIQFSPDGRRLAYEARRGTQNFIVLDGGPIAFGKYETGWFHSYHLTFSPDGRHVCWTAAGTDREKVVFVDGRETERVTGVYEGPTFSPDSKSVAYGALNGRELWWKVLGVR